MRVYLSGPLGVVCGLAVPQFTQKRGVELKSAARAHGGPTHFLAAA
jgi:hypothetical protein